MTVIYKGIRFNVDSKGKLLDYSQFSREWVEYCADKMKIKLTDDHWKILETAHAFFVDLNQAPNIRDLYQLTGMKASEILQLFPGGFSTILKMAAI